MATKKQASRSGRSRRRIFLVVAIVGVLLVAATIGTAVFTSTQIVNGALSVSYQKADESPYNVEQWGYAGDPMSALGLKFQDVTYPTELGDEPAWLVPGDPEGRWVVLLHGKGGQRAEMLRNLQFFHARGDNVLVIQYRNDVGSPEDPSGYYQYGLTEAADLTAAVNYLTAKHDAQNIVLFGNSAGGGVILSYLGSRSASDKVSAAILDAPIIDLPSTLVWNMNGVPLPAPILGLGTRFAEASTGLDFSRIDFSAAPANTRVPILILHGTDDTAAPLTASQAMARDYPRTVTLVEFAGAGHCESWNLDRDRYDTALRDFLAKTA